MDLESRKQPLYERLKKLLSLESEGYPIDEIEPMTVNELNARIDKSMEDSKNGRLTESKDLKSKIDKWR